MAIVSFWTEDDKETGQTSTAIAVATQMAIQHNKKVLLISTYENNKEFEAAYLKPKAQKTNLLSLLNLTKKSVGIESGVTGLMKIEGSNKLSPELIKDYTGIIFKDRLEVLSGYDGVETLVIGKEVQKVDGYTGDYTFKVEISYEVDAENPNYASYNGLLYDKNFETLLAVPRKISNISYHSNVKAVGEFAYAFCEMNPVVIPWGVTQIGPQAFKGMTYGKVVLPDTVKDYGDLTYPAFEDAVDFICSEENQSINTILEGEYGTAMKTSILRQDISKYYPDRQVKSGWVQEGGKWYYYQNNVKTTGWQKVGPTWYYMDANGVMQTGWITLGGTKYLLRDWGGMAANGWYQIGGKWYYFNSWGGMEKNSWIYGLDKKWYYVGSDGAMLTNTRTPDGYWVNGDGVWVR